MRDRFFLGNVMTLVLLLALVPAVGSAKEVVQEWELVNPAGAFKIIPLELAPRLASLEGKTIVLRWNVKPGGDFYLDRVAELLAKQVPTAKVIKAYDVDPSTRTANGVELAKKIAALKPHLVISSQAD
jgi:hypothetical protein